MNSKAKLRVQKTLITGKYVILKYCQNHLKIKNEFEQQIKDKDCYKLGFH